MIWFQGQLIVYDKLDGDSEKKVHQFIANIAHVMKQSKGETT